MTARQLFLFAVAALSLLPNVAWSQVAQPTKLAFLVGVDKYQKDGLSDLNYPDDDARAMAEALRPLGFEVDSLVGPQAMLGTIRQQFAALVAKARKLNKTDLVLVALFGHGIQVEIDRNGQRVSEAFYCPYDALKSDATTLLPISDLMSALERESGSSQNLIVIDACRDDPTRGGRGLDGSTVKELPAKLSVLFACSSGQRSFESEKVNHGIFTHVLLEGLRGEVANRRGEVAWINLAAHVTSEVPLRVKELIPELATSQRPNLLGNLVTNPVLGVINSPESAPKPGTLEAVVTVEALDLKLAYIPAGEFQMGSNESDVEKPVHTVKITKPFYMGTYEVTQGQWTKLMGDEPWVTKPSEDAKKYIRSGRDYPATYVSHDDAVDFCRKVTAQERQANRLATNEVYRLPTEAEWEYACRAGTGTKYSFGDSEARLGDYAWYGAFGDGNATMEQYAHRVGTKLPNPWGLYDMHGNAWEWCQDWYDEGYYGRSPAGDPVNLQANKYRVGRGGSWDDYPVSCRSAFRNGYTPDFRFGILGFRLVRGSSSQ